MRYLSYVLFPLVAAYSVYTLLYETHRSWYSWILNTLVGAVYTFGFVLMVGPPSACSLLSCNIAMLSTSATGWMCTFRKQGQRGRVGTLLEVCFSRICTGAAPL